MMLCKLLLALAVSIALADSQAADPALRGSTANDPPTPVTQAASADANATDADEDSYIERDLIKDEGKTLADVKLVDLQTCALFCDTLSSCNSFAYASQDGGKCSLKGKVVKASDEAAQEQNGFHTYFRDMQVQDVKGEPGKSAKESAEANETKVAQQEGSSADEEVPTADLNKVYHDMEGISSTWGNFIACGAGRVCRGGWYGGVCRGGFYCRGHRGWHGRPRYGGGGCGGVRVCRGGWFGGVCHGGFYCRRYR